MRPKLLLADDSITVQRVIELTLADEGLDVLTVGDGHQAVERIEHDQPAIVLVDLTMPGRDGYGVAEFVKLSPDHAPRTRVVLLTGAFEPIDQARADRLGIDGVLAKPFEPQVAIDLVRSVLAQAPKKMQPGEAAAEAESKDTPAAASGYPFEPGPPRSSSTQLDDYFKRLDEALASAGHKPSTALRSVLDQPQQTDKGTPMLGGHSESSDVTLGDAFSALLAAEQDEPVADTAHVPTMLPATAFVAVETPEPLVSAPAPAPSTAPAELTMLSEAAIEQVVRRVLDQMSDRVLREIIDAKVLDIAERLVREEIDRLKARAESRES